MALIDCLECNKKVSSNATACPNCGNTDLRTKEEKSEQEEFIRFHNSFQKEKQRELETNWKLLYRWIAYVFSLIIAIVVYFVCEKYANAPADDGWILGALCAPLSFLASYILIRAKYFGHLWINDGN